MMDILTTAVFAVSLTLVGLLVKWCDKELNNDD